MEVQAGWNTQYGGQKFGVKVSDTTDLPRILREHEIDLAEADGMTFTTVFDILHAEAEVTSLTVHGRFAISEARSKGQDPTESPEVVALAKSRKAYQAKLDALLAPYIAKTARAAKAPAAKTAPKTAAARGKAAATA